MGPGLRPSEETVLNSLPNSGRFLGVPKGADHIRVHHPHIYFQDESAFLPEAQQAFDAVRPVAKQIICVSSDEIGWFHSECKLETT